MFDDFLDINNKIECKGCPLDTKKNKGMVNGKLSNSVLDQGATKSNHILIVLDNPHTRKTISLFQKLLAKHEIKADIVSGIDCQIKTFDVIPSPLYATYKQCNTLKKVNL